MENLVLVTLSLPALLPLAAAEGGASCTPVVTAVGELPNCTTYQPPPAADCTATSRGTLLQPSFAGFTIRFSVYPNLAIEGRGKPFQMGLLSQCDCVCNRADPSREPLHHGGFLLGATNCRDPLNRTDPQCWQATYTNLSFYLANTNYTFRNGTVNASLEDTGAHGWLEGPPMFNGTWNDVSVVWRPDATNLGTGTLSMSVDNPRIGQEQTTSYAIQNASNIVPPPGTPFIFGSSRFPNLAPCHPFFGKLRDLQVWNGIDCHRTNDGSARLKTDDDLRVPHTVIWRGTSLAARRADDTGPTKSAIRALLQSADAALMDGPFAVTNKTVAPPGGSTHDYWSVASYFWPCNVSCNHTLWEDCTRWCEPPLILHDGRSCVPAPKEDNITCDKSTGLPWASHDGYPRSADRTGRYLQGDRHRADGITISVSTLALGWYFTADGLLANATAAGLYLRRAVLLMRTFFLDAQTQMHPNLNFAQGEPGRNDGQPGGTVDFGRLWMILDSVRLIESDPGTLAVWTSTDRQSFREWVAEFLRWWMYSPNGRLARQFRNNIGSAYDVQGLSMATFLQNATAAIDLVQNDVRGRVDVQINATGSLPMEDGRSNSFGYHVGNAIQFLNLAVVVNGARRPA